MDKPERKILAIDDNRNNLISLKAVLSDRIPDIRLLTAANGTTGIELARAEDPDVVILDVVMPGMDGYQVCRKLKEDERLCSIPVLFLTAIRSDRDLRVKAMEVGAEGFLTKPFDEIELTAQIRAMVKLKSANRLQRAEKQRLETLVAERTRDLECELREHMEAEKALRESKALYQSLVNQLPQCVFRKDPKGYFTFGNRPFCEFFGVTPSELLGRQDSDLFPPEMAERIREDDIRVMQSGRSWTEIGRYRARQAVSERIVEVVKWPIYTATGELAGVQGIFWDVTEREHAAERLAEQAALLNAARESILVKDLKGRIIFWNEGAERTYGWTSAEALGRNSFELLGEDPMHYRDAVAKLLEKEEWQGESIRHTKDGRELTMELRWTLVRDKNGNPKSVLAIGNDITEKKNLEAQFLRAQRLESIGTLAGGIAHDLNNILSPILISIELLMEDEQQPERLKWISTLEASARRGTDLIKQVLSFARGVEGKRLPLMINHIAREIKRIVNQTFPKNIKFTLHEPADLWQVTGDPTQLQQVLMNLCVNARDAMPKGGQIVMTLQNTMLNEANCAANPQAIPGSYVVIEVSDTGIGIPLGIQDRVFEPFFTTKEPGRGTGLGLSTTLAIVKSHGGFINLSSQPSQGTHFNIYLPVSIDSKQTEKRVLQPLRSQRGNGELLLVVDDEEAIRVMVQQMLERFGYRVLLAANGVEAVALYEEHQAEIALVLTDLAMPVMDGPATIAALRAKNPEVKIIASSGLGSNYRAQPEVADFVSKPYTTDTLLTSLRRVLSEP